MNAATLIPISAFIATALAALAAGTTWRELRGQKRVDRLTRRLSLDTAVANDDPPTAVRPPEGKIDRALFTLLEQSGSRLSPAAASLIVAAVAGLCGAVAFVATDNLLFAAIALAIGAVAAPSWWMFRRRRRLAKMNKQLADTLDLLADATGSGRGIERSFEWAAQESDGPLAEEFSHAASLLTLGHAPQYAIERMIRRAPLDELRLLGVALLVHRKTGGDLVMLLRRLAAAARDRQQFRGHLGAVTAGARFSAFGLILVTVIGITALSYIEPEYLDRFWEYRIGPTLLVVAAVLQAAGILWVWRILRVKY